MKKYITYLLILSATVSFGQDRGVFGFKTSVGFNSPIGGFGIGLECRPLNKLGLHLGTTSGNIYQGFGLTGGIKIYPIFARISPYLGIDYGKHSSKDFVYLDENDQETDLLMPAFYSYRLSLGLRSDIDGRYVNYESKELFKYLSWIISVHYMLQDSPSVIYQGGYNNENKIDAINKLSKFKWGISFDFILIINSLKPRKDKNIPTKKWFI